VSPGHNVVVRGYLFELDTNKTVKIISNPISINAKVIHLLD